MKVSKIAAWQDDAAIFPYFYSNKKFGDLNLLSSVCAITKVKNYELMRKQYKQQYEW